MNLGKEETYKTKGSLYWWPTANIGGHVEDRQTEKIPPSQGEHSSQKEAKGALGSDTVAS